MPGFLFHVGAQALCPHAGQVSTVSSNTRVKVGGQAVATTVDTFTVAGCTFVVASSPHPCVKVQWLQPAARVKVMGNPVVLQTSAALCLAGDQAPQGPPQVTVAQQRVKGS